MEKIYCESCGNYFEPHVSGYGEVNTICPICGDDTTAPTGFYEDIEEEENFWNIIKKAL